MNPNYSGIERRQFTRIPFWYIVRYRKSSKTKRFEKGQSKNLSMGGMLLETNEKYPVSSHIEIEIDVPVEEKEHKKVKVIGKVVRSIVIEKDKIYDTAVKFTSIPLRYKEKIEQLIGVFAKA